MMKLSATGRAWVKGFHIVCTCAWIGAGVCMCLLNFVARPNNSHDLYVVMAALKLIDDWMIIPAALGSLFTGLLLSWLTPWGFFKWRWVVVKWVLTIIMTIFGIFFLSPWLREMAEISATDPVGVFQNEAFLTNRWLLSISGGPMFVGMFFLVFISVIKPWSGRKKGTAASRSSVHGTPTKETPKPDGTNRWRRGQHGALSAPISDSGDGLLARQQGGATTQISSDHQPVV
jgi:uncharacterized membrane protein